MARASRLMQTLVHVLARDDVGARALKLSLYRVDGAVKTVDIGLTLADPRRRPCGAPVRPEARSAGGTAQEKPVSASKRSASPSPQPKPCRRGRRNSCRPSARWRPHASDARLDRYAAPAARSAQRAAASQPSQATCPSAPKRCRPSPAKQPAWPAPEQQTRPLLLFPHAEPAEVTALIPDGPPRRFRWRGVTYDIAGAQGPERIAAEWWRRPRAASEMAEGRPATITSSRTPHGRRFWLFREGLYGRETTAARWFVHGLFA